MEEIRQIWCEEDNRYYPEIKIEDGRTYKPDCETFVYLEQLDLGEAWEMWELLRKQYAVKNPRPKTFLEIVSWEKMRQLAVEHEIMEQIVLQYRA